MSNSNQNDVVCVTGGSGCIGSWLVRLLLERRYTVHATVKNLNDDKETEHLRALEGADTRLRLFQIDLLDYDSIVAAISGCAGVFHLASPCIVDRVLDPQKELLDPAIKGTINVLTAAKAAGVRRVVVTSSISAITPSPHWPADKIKAEDCWADVEYCKQKETLAEKAAWDFSRENGLDVVVVNPGTVMGPVIPPTLNASMLMLVRLLQGCTETYEDFFMGSIHFKDVALAHILVYENPSASGRHLCVEAISHYGDFAAKVAELYPEYNLPRLPRDTQPGLLRAKDGGKKLMDLGLQFIPMEEIIKDSINNNPGMVLSRTGTSSCHVIEPVMTYQARQHTQKTRGGEQNNKAEMSNQNGVVCVTGGSGCIGSWLVRLLLDRRYTVHATVKNLNDDKETEHLRALEGADTRLRLFQIDLLDYDSIVAAVSGCAGVFHLASPNIIDRVLDPQKELLDPAIKGTINVLTAAKAAGVRRVVVTSSVAAIMPSPHWPADKVKSEDCWTDVESSWDFSKENGLDVVVVNPGVVMGPVIPPTLTASMLILLRLLQGCTETYEDIWMGSVHFKDVALAHILVYENPSASGRHLSVEAISHYGDFVAKVAELYPEYNVPRLPRDTQPGLLRTKDAGKKLMDLGLQFIPLEQIIKDSVESLKSKGFIS
ncbi:hypothetical protein EZV62_003010 [Acer yangbiense]|uniref:NAD-dependent epimerase/dehydratase domain-containing protein n=1 Tax=Acer yangbiense TaxID=1000413 RepID=A0A5C7IYX4_9ROSI|nr:hypothetical protein EZV62_003010 [Acer yangbiense]